MGLAQRLKRLEKIAERLKQPDVDVSEKVLSDDEEADNTGKFLWAGGTGGCHSRYPSSNTKTDLHTCDEYCEWGKAAEAARAAGHTEYHVGLRPIAMAIWLRWKPGVLEHRRTHGEWIYDEPPTRLETMTSDERGALSPTASFGSVR
jgi:hypothetical protein